MSETLDAPQTEAAPAPDVSPSDDLRSAISAAYDELSTDPETPEPEAAPTGISAAERDERGRFTSGAASGSGEPTDTETPAETPAETVVEAAPAIPPDLAPLKAVLDENKSLYEARGLPPAEAVRALFGAQKALQERPYEAIQALARDFGVDLTRFAQQPAQQSQQPGPTNDPAVNAALARIERWEMDQRTRETQAEQANTAQINQTIAQFRADPKHTHFPVVQRMMGALMTSGEANDLATAYDMACRAHPEVSKAIQKAEAAARDGATAEAQRKAAAEAKARAVSVRGSAPVRGFTPQPGSIRETLEAAYDGRLN